MVLVSRCDPNAVFAEVGKNKRHITRQSTGRDTLRSTQYASYPVDDSAGSDSWCN